MKKIFMLTFMNLKIENRWCIFNIQVCYIVRMLSSFLSSLCRFCQDVSSLTFLCKFFMQQRPRCICVSMYHVNLICLLDLRRSSESQHQEWIHLVHRWMCSETRIKKRKEDSGKDLHFHWILFWKKSTKEYSFCF